MDLLNFIHRSDIYAFWCTTDIEAKTFLEECKKKSLKASDGLDLLYIMEYWTPLKAFYIQNGIVYCAELSFLIEEGYIIIRSNLDNTEIINLTKDQAIKYICEDLEETINSLASIKETTFISSYIIEEIIKYLERMLSRILELE